MEGRRNHQRGTGLNSAKTGKTVDAQCPLPARADGHGDFNVEGSGKPSLPGEEEVVLRYYHATQ